MNRSVVLALCLISLVSAGGWYVYQRSHSDGPRFLKQRVFVGDTRQRVFEILGEPSIEFPRDGRLIQWFEGCEVTMSNDVVVDVEMIPIESEEERMMRELSVQEDENRLRKAYEAVMKKEAITYAAWLDREENRMVEQQRERAKIKAYEKRRAEERRKAAIRAEAIRRARLRCY